MSVVTHAVSEVAGFAGGFVISAGRVLVSDLSHAIRAARARFGVDVQVVLLT